MGRTASLLLLVGLLLACVGAALVGMSLLGDDPLPPDAAQRAESESSPDAGAKSSGPPKPARAGDADTAETQSVQPVPNRRPRKRDGTALHDAAKKAAAERLAELAAAERRLCVQASDLLVRESRETRDGFVEDRDRDGTVIRSGMVVAGVRDGTWTFNYRDGTRVQTTYDTGEKTGLEAAWRPDGKPKFQGEYLQGEKHGTWTSWHANGNVRTTQSFDLGKPVGDWLTFHEDGSMAELQTYFDGLQVGLDRGWHARGGNAWEIPVENGKRHGHAIWWDADGEVEHEADFEHGKEIARAE